MKDARHADGIGNQEADDNGPQHIFDVGKWNVVGLGVAVDGCLDDLAPIADGDEQKQAGNKRKNALERVCGPIRISGLTERGRGIGGGCHENLLAN